MQACWIKDPSPVWDKIKPWMVDDNGELATQGTFIGVFDGEKMAGAFLIKPWNQHCYEIHGGVHPDYWGRGAEVCEELGRSLFTGTPCLSIVAVIPEFNRLMRACVQKAGMKEEGRVKKAFLKHFKLHDLIVYGISKTEVERSRLCPPS